MPYETGTASSFSDLKTSIFTFLTANGYTQEGANLIKKGDLVVELIASSLTYISYTGSYLQIRGGKNSDGLGNLVLPRRADYDVNSTSRELWPAGLTAWMGFADRETAEMTFPISYHFHLATNPDEFWCIINFDDARCQQLAFGTALKSLPYEGGTWTWGSSRIERLGLPDIQLSAHYPFSNDGVTATSNFSGGEFWAETTDNPYAYSGEQGWHQTGYSGAGHSNLRAYIANHEAVRNSESGINDIPIMQVVQFDVLDDAGQYATYGIINGCRIFKTSALNSFGQVVSDGTDQWKFYPCYRYFPQNNSVPSGDQSGRYCIAIKYDGP